MQDIKSKRITLLEKENYKVDLEYNEDFVILHLPRVDKFTKSVYLDMKFMLEDYSDFFKTAGYKDLCVAIGETDKTMKKFIKKFGFVYAGNASSLDVYLYGGSL